MEFLKYLESIRTPFWENLFYYITYGGEEIMLLGLVCILFWCVDKKLGYRMMFVYLPSALIINTLKLGFRVERPWIKDPSFTAVERAKASATGYSFPSGHTQNATTLFGTIAYKIKKSWAYILFTVLILLVMLSRMYLGVHTPADVIVSFLITTVVVFAVNMITDRIELNKRRRLIITCVLIVLAIIYVIVSLVLIDTGKVSYANAADGFKGVGAGLAFATCWYIESVRIDFDVKCRYKWQQVLKVIIGVAGVLLIRSGIKALFDPNIVTDMIRYFLMMSWIMFAMPLLIKRFFQVPAMRRTTQCYISRKNGKSTEYLMLYRNKKPEDPNEGKWLGIGGKVEAGETPVEANIREVYEETGIRLEPDDCLCHGIVKFINTVYEDEEIYLYSATVPYDTQIIDCDEGELHWVGEEKMPDLNMWEGDRRFLIPLLNGETGINITLFYDKDKLIRESR